MPMQGASHGQTFLSRRPTPFKANLGKRISWRLQKPVPVPSTLACLIGPICRHHSLCRMHLRKQRFSAPPLKLCLSCRLSLHLLNNNFVCFFKENLQQQRRLRLAIEARDTCTLSVNDLKKNYCHHCHTKALLCQLLWNKTQRTDYITSMGLVFFKAVAFVPGLSGDRPLLLRHSDASFIITMPWPICQEKKGSH